MTSDPLAAPAVSQSSDIEPIIAATPTSAAQDCPAYIGPSCSTPQHELWATGQRIVGDLLP